MNRLCAALAAIALVMPAFPASAATAGEMLSHCREIANARQMGGGQGLVTFEQTFESGLCWGGFSVFQQLIVRRYRAEPLPMLHVCAPPESRLIQLVRVFIGYAEAHPESLHEDFAEVALRSFWKAFPCAGEPATSQ